MTTTDDLLEALNSRLVFKSVAVMKKYSHLQRSLYKQQGGREFPFNRRLWIQCALEVRGMLTDKEKGGTSHGPA